MTPLTRHNNIYGAHVQKRFRFSEPRARRARRRIAGNATDYFMG